MFIIGSILLFAQGELTTGELNFWIANNGGGATVEVEMELVSSLCWDASAYYPDTHNLTDLFGGGTISTNSTSLYLEFLACWETTVPNYFRTFGLGYYKFTGRVNGIDKDYFYIDYRTQDLPENFNSGGSGDINITFNISDGKFYFYGTQNLFPAATSIWDQKTWVDIITTELEPLPPTNLTQTATWGAPYLEWAHAAITPNWRTAYKIYRSIDSPNNFSPIGTVSAGVNNFIDNELILNGGGTAYYKLTAINGSRESVFSNTIEVSIVEIGKTNQYQEITTAANLRLEQNYPNPFNPKTTIALSLSENFFVTLKVFDMLGREVAVLVNELLNAGNHQVQFDASGLESGVYFYEIRAGNFRDVKKLILTKQKSYAKDLPFTNLQFYGLRTTTG